jgi:hypothetical protein
VFTACRLQQDQRMESSLQDVRSAERRGCGDMQAIGTIKRQVSQLRDQYDFIIAGGGTSGLTVADRLTDAFPNSKSHISPLSRRRH